jgi:CheY-like chemotaxis protein
MENPGYIGECDLRRAVTTPPQILIVEDDAETRDALWALLENHGYSVTLAANGADGLSRLRGGLRPCLILLDLMMPEKNGFQFRVEQVADPVLADIPVIIYSGNPEAQADGAVLGGVACLTKPIDVDRLLEAVKAHC